MKLEICISYLCVSQLPGWFPINYIVLPYHWVYDLAKYFMILMDIPFCDDVYKILLLLEIFSTKEIKNTIYSAFYIFYIKIKVWKWDLPSWTSREDLNFWKHYLFRDILLRDLIIDINKIDWGWRK